MMKGQIFVLIVLASALVYNLVDAEGKCNVTDGFEIDKLNGTWQYVAGISPKKDRIKCGYLVLNRVSKYNFDGYRIGFFNGKPQNMTITAYVRDNIMDLRSFVDGQNIQVVYMWMRTCNGVSELALENPRQRFYWIFSRGTTISPSLLEYYQQIGKERGLRLRCANNKYCAKL